MPAKASKKKTTKKTASKFVNPSTSKKILFLNIGVAAIAVIGFMGYEVLQSITTADAATNSTAAITQK
jgi:uncharacterized protein (DUF4213/DUF364 family)